MITLYTVTRESLLAEAARIEADANSSLRAWILLGQSDRYGDDMARARAVRSAAAEKSVWTRREILRNSGYVIKSPKTIGVAA